MSEVLLEWLNADCGLAIRSSQKLAEVQSPFQHIDIHDTATYGRLMRIDGIFMTSERDEFFYHENMVQVPLVAHPAPKRMLIIGGGDGGSAEEALKHPDVAVTMVELDAAVVELSQQYLGNIHRNAFDHPRLDLRIGDGFAFLADPTNAGQYDVIVLDLTDPVGQAEMLYSVEFYRLCAQALSADGIMTLHIGSPISSRERHRQSLANLRQVFRHVNPYHVFIPLYGALWGLCAVSNAVDVSAIAPAAVDRILAERGISDLQYYHGEMHRAGFVLPRYLQD